MQITDELIEKAARAKYEEDREILKPALSVKLREWEELRDFDREVHLREARAALEAVLPDVIEACAKVADGLNGWGADCGRGGHASHIALAIRNLSPKQKD